MSLKLEELVGKSITEAQFDEAAGKKDACYHKVKARYDVWPSAYASGALVKCRKVGAKNWGNKSKKEGVDEAKGKKAKVASYNVFGSMRELSFNLKKVMDIIDKDSQYRKLSSELGNFKSVVDKKLNSYQEPLKKVSADTMLESTNEGLDDLKALPKDLKKSIKKNRKESVNEAMKNWNDIPKSGTIDFGKYGKYVIISKNRMRVSGKFISGSNKGKSVKWYSRDGQKDARTRKGMSLSDTPRFPYKMVKESFGGVLRNLAKHAAKKRMYDKMKKRKRDKGGRFEDINEARGTCWVGYKQVGMKDKGGKKVPNCVKEVYDIYWENNLGESCGYTFEFDKENDLNEAEYQGRKVKLGKPMQGDTKKFIVYVKNPKGNVVKVNFGQGGGAKGGTMKIRKSNPKARKSFRARHNCDNPGPRHKARYWSCRKW